MKILFELFFEKKVVDILQNKTHLKKNLSKHLFEAVFAGKCPLPLNCHSASSTLKLPVNAWHLMAVENTKHQTASLSIIKPLFMILALMPVSHSPEVFFLLSPTTMHG